MTNAVLRGKTLVKSKLHKVTLSTLLAMSAQGALLAGVEIDATNLGRGVGMISLPEGLSGTYEFMGRTLDLHLGTNELK